MNKRAIASIVCLALFVVIILIVWFSSQKKIESSNNFATEQTVLNTNQVPETTPNTEKTETNELVTETNTKPQKQTDNVNEPDSFGRATYVVETQSSTYSDEDVKSFAWKSFTLTIDNVDYNLPCDVNEFEKIGYKMSKDFASQNVNYGWTNNPQLVNDKKYFTAYVINNSDITLPCSDCDTFGIEIYLSTFSEDLEIKIGDFILSKATTPTQLKASFGVPTSEDYTPDGMKTLYYESIYNNEVFWAFSFTNDSLSTIILQGDANV